VSERLRTSDTAAESPGVRPAKGVADAGARNLVKRGDALNLAVARTHTKNARADASPRSWAFQAAGASQGRLSALHALLLFARRRERSCPEKAGECSPKTGARHDTSLVVGSITDLTSEIRFAGKPPHCARSRTAAPFGAM